MLARTLFTLFILRNVRNLFASGLSCQVYTYPKGIPSDTEGPYDEAATIVYDYDSERDTDCIVTPFLDDVKWAPGFIQFSVVKGAENCSRCVLTARGANDYDMPSLTEVRMEFNKVFSSPICIKAFKIMCD